MDGEDLDAAQPMDSYLLIVPRGTMVDGAVTELSLKGRRLVTADVRIPAPQEG